MNDRSISTPLRAGLLLAVVGLFPACSASPSAAPPAAEGSAAHERPNILLILADDLDYADLGSYGNQVIATPNLDHLAREGMRFTSFYANGSICTPTRVSILTGRYPQRFGVFSGLAVDSSWGLPPETVTMPRVLRDAGYESAHLGKWHVGHAEERFWPTALGFDRFFGFLHAHHLPTTYLDPKLRRDGEAETVHPGHLTDLLTAEAEAFLRGRTAEDPPFFVNLWYFSPHKPIEPPARWADRYPATSDGRFAALVSTLDENVGRLLAALQETGLAERTLVLFLSDNGGVADAFPGRESHLSGGKNEWSEGGIRVPLIVRWPGEIAAGATSDALAATFDLLPTFADLAGVDVRALPLDGRSLAPVLRGLPDAFEGPLFWEDVVRDQHRFAVRQGRFKLLSAAEGTELYDLTADPGEATDLAADRPEVVAELLAAYRAWHAVLPPPAPALHGR